MADVVLECEQCKGKRFKKNILEIKYQNHSIDDLLRLSVDEPLHFSKSTTKSDWSPNSTLQAVGLGYVALGQSSATLSGGEAQRIKLASFISKGSQERYSSFLTNPLQAFTFTISTSSLQPFKCSFLKDTPYW